MSEHEYPLDDSPESDAFRSGFAAGVAACREKIEGLKVNVKPLAPTVESRTAAKNWRDGAKGMQQGALDALSSLPGDRKEARSDG